MFCFIKLKKLHFYWKFSLFLLNIFFVYSFTEHFFNNVREFRGIQKGRRLRRHMKKPAENRGLKSILRDNEIFYEPITFTAQIGLIMFMLETMMPRLSQAA